MTEGKRGHSSREASLLKNKQDNNLISIDVKSMRTLNEMPSGHYSVNIYSWKGENLKGKLRYYSCQALCQSISFSKVRKLDQVCFVGVQLRWGVFRRI